MRAWIAGLTLLAVVGIVLALAGDDTLDVIAIVLVGVAAVGAVSLGFYAIGRSEDKARAAEAAHRDPSAQPENGDGRITSRRPPRSRGDA
jgi:hypothetical protein